MSKSKNPLHRPAPKQVVVSSASQQGVVEFNHYKATATTILSKRNKQVSILQPLFAPNKRPRGGWGVTIKINGFAFNIGGIYPENTYGNLVSHLTINDIPYEPKDVWLTLNILWLEDARENDSLVFLQDLYTIAAPQSNTPQDGI